MDDTSVNTTNPPKTLGLEEKRMLKMFDALDDDLKPLVSPGNISNVTNQSLLLIQIARGLNVPRTNIKIVDPGRPGGNGGNGGRI